MWLLARLLPRRLVGQRSDGVISVCVLTSLRGIN